ncbi:MAG: esterase [Chitinophagaceae bacterium]|jgi:enterochelin esterase-like enzyme|nr:esterase [Chitinophagaceae bacterium]
MQTIRKEEVIHYKYIIISTFLKRNVLIHVFLPKDYPGIKNMPLLLINDGQNMEEVGLEKILHGLFQTKEINPICCVAIEAGADRKREYGVAGVPDYLGFGNKAGFYVSFIMQELLPFLQETYPEITFTQKSFAGFSLGGLSALDIVWHYPEVFKIAGVFSGSLWWRSMDAKDIKYNDDQHRIMHNQIRKGKHYPGTKFFFQCGNMDETQDRNNNGIIDSIDDTQDLIRDLESKGYDKNKDIFYYEMPDGRHDMASWGKAFPVFLKWGFS